MDRETQDLIHKSKVIAIFLDDYIDDLTWRKHGFIPSQGPHYHDDLNWLMPAIKKFMQLRYYDEVVPEVLIQRKAIVHHEAIYGSVYSCFEYLAESISIINQNNPNL